MRIQDLREIKICLENAVKAKGYYIYIAPLLQEHYNSYMGFVMNSHNENLQEALEDEEKLKENTEKIDQKTEILVDTNLYVAERATNEPELRKELLDFLKDNKINYDFLLSNKNLILALENKPDNKLNN